MTRNNEILGESMSRLSSGKKKESKWQLYLQTAAILEFKII
jgi:hypothetical protein